MTTTAIPQPRQFNFLPKDFKLNLWSALEPYYEELLNRPINSVSDLEHWILDHSELDAMISEDFSWRYIRVTSDSRDQAANDDYQYAAQELAPRITAYDYKLNKKLADCPFLEQLDPSLYAIHIRNARNTIALFCDENIPLVTEVQLKSKEYGRLFSEMTVGVNGVQMTLQKAGALLEETDRGYRESIYHKINQRILQDTESLEELFDEMLRQRHLIARNAGFDNFRDYRFQSLGRFDYSAGDCLAFHDAIEFEILPLLDELNEHRRQLLELQTLRPWDLNVDTCGQQPLRPFDNAQELAEKTVACLSRLHPYFGEVIQMMREKGHLDIESRMGKRPGGYNMPLHLTGVPFIFMNAANSVSDMRTLLHESGHAIHSLLTHEHQLSSAKRVPFEVAELAAMAMELFTMDHWDIFFHNEEQLRRAKIGQLENVLKVLPWIATIDQFQHWIYTHPDHSREARKEKWMEILHHFSSNLVDYSGLEHYLEYLWHKQLHIFEAPFYFVEYGFAQLGAIALWKQYRENPEQTIQNYINALKLGYTQPINDIYKTAGISFNFSREYVRELGAFVKSELMRLL